MIRCHICGAEFLKDCLRCSNCGTPWDKNAPPYQPPVPVEPAGYAIPTGYVDPTEYDDPTVHMASAGYTPPPVQEAAPDPDEDIWQIMDDDEPTIALFRPRPKVLTVEEILYRHQGPIPIRAEDVRIGLTYCGGAYSVCYRNGTMVEIVEYSENGTPLLRSFGTIG